MNDNEISKLAEQLIDKDRWSDILQRFIDVLRINIFLVDHKGRALLTPCKGRYGWELLEASPIGMELLNERSSLLDKFKQHGFYLEYHYPFDLHNFAVPVYAPNDIAIAYLILGPVILNRKLEPEQYEKIAHQLGMDSKVLLNAIGELRTMSFIGIKSILDLLDEVAHYTIHLKAQKSDFSTMDFSTQTVLKEANKEAKDILSSIYLDELLTLFLDMALKVTKTECGSVMFINSQTGEMTIKISRGLKKEAVQSVRQKIGEGIAGIAAKENKSIVIHGTETTHNRIKKYLKRPEIKHALVTPICTNNRVIGVLNLSTKKEEDALQEESLTAVNLLKKMASVAINSIQQKTAEISD